MMGFFDKLNGFYRFLFVVDMQSDRASFHLFP